MPISLLLQSTLTLAPFEIIKLVGFATGTALHAYLCLMLLRRYGWRHVERTLLALGAIIGLWHLGNFAEAIHELLKVRGGLWWLRAAHLTAYLALAFLPPVMVHAHVTVWRWFDGRAGHPAFKALVAAGYAPLILLPWVAARLISQPYQPPIEKLSSLLFPFIGWFVFIFFECALLDWYLARQQQAVRERRFFEALGATLLCIGLLFLLTYVVGARTWGTSGRYLELLARLASLAPTTLVAYYIYRYRYLELVIRQSFVYAAVAAVAMIVYVSGIRRFSLFLDARYGMRPEAVEALLILVLLFLAGPLRRVTDRYLHRLMTSEVGLYRELVAQVGAAAASYGELAHFIAYAEQRLRDALELSEVKIVPQREAQHAEADVCRIAEERGMGEVEEAALLQSLGALACYVLRREGRVIGLLIVRGASQLLTSEKREILAVLAGHIAVAVENSQLLAEKVRLERELAERERMAALGQMAAVVAHEVKNPLSAIKSITQVMREDESVSREYARDLDLINGEVDRLNRSVSQLLSFSRPAVVAASAMRLSVLLESVTAIARAEANGRAVQIDTRLAADPALSGEQAAALKEVLINLTLNAVQAMPDGGHVLIESEAVSDRLRLTISDDGVGIPAAMREKIFEPFFTTKQRGTGLGLAIVARRVSELSGTIHVTSPVTDGHGTRFELQLPPT